MVVWLGVLFWETFVCLTWKHWFIVKKSIRSENQDMKPTFFSLLLSQLPIIIIIGLRRSERIGDTGNYIRIYESVVPSWSNLINYDGREKGWLAFQMLLKLLGLDASGFLLVVAFIHMILLLFIIREYSLMPGVSLYLFVASVEFCYMFNGIRQFMAVMILFAGFKLLVKKKYLLYVLLIIFAVQFHTTAFAMLIALAASFIKPFSKQMYIIFAVFTVGLLFLNPLLNAAEFFFEGTVYENNMDLIKNSAGVNVLRLFVAVVPCVLLFLFRKNEEFQKNRVFALAINFTFIYAGIYLVATMVGGNLMARFSEYFAPYLMISYPMIFKRCLKGNIRIFVVGAFGVFYFAWYYYQMFINWNLCYESSILGLYYY